MFRRVTLTNSLAPRGVNLKQEVLAGVVVFLVALPLCLGIALASGAPMLSGLLAGVIGGVMVGILGGSPLSVSGPAAGLTVIVLAAAQALGYDGLLTALVLAGGLQLAFGVLKLGGIAAFIPASVIRGMLAAIGILLIIGQLPYALGWQAKLADVIGLRQGIQSSLLQPLGEAFGDAQWGAVLVSGIGFGVLFLWAFLQRQPWAGGLSRWLPAPLVVVVLGGGTNALLLALNSPLALGPEYCVQLPDFAGFGALWTELPKPNWAKLSYAGTYSVAITIALVASLETLLSLEAVDRLDPMHRHSQPNREMLAQGAGNLLNGLLGGMPITAVIVRSAANIEAGGRSRLPALLHGVLLAVSIIALPRLLQVMPLAALAVVLLSVGYKLASLPLFRQMLTLGPRQYLPFFVTVGAILLTDLLVGIGIGLAVSVALVLKTHYDQGLVLEPRPDATGRPIYRLELPAHLSFFHKASLRGLLRSLPDHVSLAVDGSEVAHWDADILETLLEFRDNARHRGIEVTLLGLPDNPPVVSAH